MDNPAKIRHHVYEFTESQEKFTSQLQELSKDEFDNQGGKVYRLLANFIESYGNLPWFRDYIIIRAVEINADIK